MLEEQQQGLHLFYKFGRDAWKEKKIKIEEQGHFLFQLLTIKKARVVSLQLVQSWQDSVPAAGGLCPHQAVKTL